MTKKKSREVVQKEAFSATCDIDRCGIGVAMGVGKTLIGLMHMHSNYHEFARFLVVAPKKTIMDTWKDEAIKHNYAYLIPHMTFTTYLSLPKQDLDYDVVYLDECHSLKYTHEVWLTPYTGKILGLTGTPPKYGKSEKSKMIEKYCPIVYRYVIDTAVTDEILNDYRIVVHLMSLSKAKTLPMKKGERSWFTSEHESYKYWTNRIDAAATQKEVQIMRVMRMKALMEFPSKEEKVKTLLASAKNKVIVFANTQEQAERICPVSYHSNNPKSPENLEKFKAGEYMQLSCVLQLSEGVNIPNLKSGIIMHAYSGSSPKSKQRLGRLFRLNPSEMATMHILCYRDTIDEVWTKETLEDLDPAKISWIPSK